VAIIGAGPAGLTAGYVLAKAGAAVTVFESDSEYVGGISRTVEYRGFRFDIGGHRFFSKSLEIENLWDEILPEPMLVRARSSRIFYRGRFFSYPLRPLEALRKLGWIESVRCALSYARARLRPVKPPRNFRDWVSNQFGARLFAIFFESYIEKVWGMPCTAISADWAAQWIKELSLIQTFRYPRLGPGMMWEACAAKIRHLGGDIRLGRRVIACRRMGVGDSWTLTAADAAGQEESICADHVISSAPIRTLAEILAPPLGREAHAAASSLKYRDFLTVVLICSGLPAFTDNWIYIHEPQVKVGRIQNFASWSPEMVPNEGDLCYGMEYFCSEGDSLWEKTDAELVELATFELEWLGLVGRRGVLDGCVVRQPKAYPVHDESYAGNVEKIRSELAANHPGLHLVGRNGLHKYHNQDHSMTTAILTAKNILAGREVFDVWAVNEDAEYHETVEKTSVESVRRRNDSPACAA
jgi:protoporphyrinogen oxidase